MLSRFQTFFSKVVEQVETRPAPFRQYCMLFFAILAVRLALEFYSSHRLFTLDDILHISLWFTFIVLVFLLLLQLFSGEKMERTAKLVITFFTLALTAPIIDLLISGGSGLKMNYLSINSVGDLLWAYVTIGGSSMVRGATPGIRIEIVILVLAAFNYVRTKRKSLLWGMLGAIVIYTALFLSGAIPLFLSLLVNALHLKYQEGDQSTLLLLLSANALLFFFCLWRYSPSRMGWLLSALPWGQMTLWGIAIVTGALLAKGMYPGNWSLNPTTLFQLVLLPAVTLCLGAVAHPRNESSGSVNAALLMAVFIAAFISRLTFFPVAVTGALSFLLYQQPLQLYRVPFLRNLLTGLVALASALTGFIAFGAPMVGFPPQWILLMIWPVAVMGLCHDVSESSGYNVTWIRNQGWRVMAWVRFLIVIRLITALFFLNFYAEIPPIVITSLLLFTGIQSVFIWFRRPLIGMGVLITVLFYAFLLFLV